MVNVFINIGSHYYYYLLLITQQNEKMLDVEKAPWLFMITVILWLTLMILAFKKCYKSIAFCSILMRIMCVCLQDYCVLNTSRSEISFKSNSVHCISVLQLWIMPAFGARPQFDNTVGSDIYEFQTWAAIVNIGMPFGIFYRMHSVASLFEVCLAS